jgi:hypothetical protein
MSRPSVFAGSVFLVIAVTVGISTAVSSSDGKPGSSTRAPRNTNTVTTGKSKAPPAPLPSGTPVAPPVNVTVTPVPHPASRARLEVFGTAPTADISYALGNAGATRLKAGALPWSVIVPLDDQSGTLYVSGYQFRQTPYPQLACRIYVNDVLVKAVQETGGVSCSIGVKNLYER